MPNIKNRNYELTIALLEQYRSAAVTNAENLLAESELLIAHKHFARAYFLAVAAIEETGKAVLAFEGMGRNIKDSAVSQRLKIQFEDHSKKITSAFTPWLMKSSNLRQEIQQFLNLMVDVKRGREPSMYTDINQDGPLVVSPETCVRPEAAESCIKLASAVLTNAKPYVMESKPRIRSKAEDALFSLKPSVYEAIFKNENFWWYFVSRGEAGNTCFATAVTEYQKSYLSKNILFTFDQS